MLDRIFRRKEKISAEQDPSFSSYAILNPCFRCVYGRRFEPIVAFSTHRGPRIILNIDFKTYVRRGDCIGYRQCGKCLEIKDGVDFAKFLEDKDKPCIWEELKALNK